MADMKRFEGKIAIVTGSARGFGRAIATKLAMGGAAVVVVDMRKELDDEAVKKIKDDGGQALGHIADISSEKEVNEMVAKTVQTFGTVDFLVNNAGIMKMATPVETISLSNGKKR